MGMAELRGPDRSSPTSFVLSFCSDYKIWNDHSFSVFSLSSEVWHKSANADYETFVKPFIDPDTNIQLATCGSDSRFDKDRVVIGSSSHTDDGLEIPFSVRSTVGDWSDDFVALLTYRPEIMLKQLFYVGPYPDNGIVRLPYL